VDTLVRKSWHYRWHYQIWASGWQVPARHGAYHRAGGDRRLGARVGTSFDCRTHGCTGDAPCRGDLCNFCAKHDVVPRLAAVAKASRCCRVSDRSVQYGLEALERRDLIRRDKRGGRGRTTRYELVPLVPLPYRLAKPREQDDARRRVTTHADESGMAPGIAPSGSLSHAEPLLRASGTFWRRDGVAAS